MGKPASDTLKTIFSGRDEIYYTYWREMGQLVDFNDNVLPASVDPSHSRYVESLLVASITLNEMLYLRIAVSLFITPTYQC